MMEVEKIPIQILHGELPQSPRLCLQWIDDLRTQRHQFLVRRVDVLRKDPVDGGFEWRLPLPEENYHLVAGDGANFFAWVKPSDLKAQSIFVMLLRAFNISDRQLRYRRANHAQFHICVHG